MQEANASVPQVRGRGPWNEGRLVGARPPLRPKHVWSIRSKLQLEKRTRELTMFNLAIDSKLRACDLVRLRVDDVAPHGQAASRAAIRQKKTGTPVKFEITEPAREALEAYIKAFDRKPGEYLFQGCRGWDHISTRTYARYVIRWIAGIGLNAHFFGTHSLRRTKATAGRATCERFNCCSGTGKSRARSAISASRSMTLSTSLNTSTFEFSGGGVKSAPPPLSLCDIGLLNSRQWPSEGGYPKPSEHVVYACLASLSRSSFAT